MKKNKYFDYETFKKYYDKEMDFYISQKEKIEKEKDRLFESMENDYDEFTKKFILKSYKNFIPTNQLDFMKKCIGEDFSITIKSKNGEVECAVESKNNYSIAVGLFILEQSIKKHKLPQPIVDIVKDLCENKVEYIKTTKE